MAVNYATQYSSELANAYPHVLNFGRLWNTENTERYKVVDAQTVKIPVLATGGRTNGNRTNIGDFTQNFSNDWETKTLTNHRVWQTLVHPKDVMETNMVASIANITKTMNETEKFPEMDAQLISSIYKARYDLETIVQETVGLTAANVLAKFDSLMEQMDEALVPANGRILYTDTFTKTLIKNAISIVRANGDKAINRDVNRLDEVEMISVPSTLMKTAYTFTTGFAPADEAKDIAMFLVHPSSILPIPSYAFAQLQEPSALSQGKYVYFEESFEDVFILNKRKGAIQFVIKKAAATRKKGETKDDNKVKEGEGNEDVQLDNVGIE